MAIKTWNQDGKTHYLINVVARSRVNRAFKITRRESGSLDETDPETLRKKLGRAEVRLAEEARREVIEREGAGVTWGDLVKKWEKALETESRTRGVEGIRDPVRRTTAHGYLQSVNDFTDFWMKRPASEITPADVEDVFKKMRLQGYSNSRMYNVKVAISRCYKWAIMRRMIPGVTASPTLGFGISRKDSKRPEILNISQIEYLHSEADQRKHSWRQVWKGAYHSGGRSGELYALKRKHLDLVERKIIFEEKYNFVTKETEDLKDGEWREVPINEDLFELFEELQVPGMDLEDFVFPRITAWKNNEAARTLRAFCDLIGVPSICFHTLRACWATQLLKNGVAEIKVMAMGGWSDPETMHRYIRLAGIGLEGATDSLSRGKRERPARVLKLAFSKQDGEVEVKASHQDLMARLLSPDPHVVAAAMREMEALRKQQSSLRTQSGS